LCRLFLFMKMVLIDAKRGLKAPQTTAPTTHPASNTPLLPLTHHP
jgi:hypothetical protein